MNVFAACTLGAALVLSSLPANAGSPTNFPRPMHEAAATVSQVPIRGIIGRPTAVQLSPDVIREMTQAKGFVMVRKLRLDDNVYFARGLKAGESWVDLRIDATTGELLGPDEAPQTAAVPDAD